MNNPLALILELSEVCLHGPCASGLVRTEPVADEHDIEHAHDVRRCVDDVLELPPLRDPLNRQPSAALSQSVPTSLPRVAPGPWSALMLGLRHGAYCVSFCGM